MKRAEWIGCRSLFNKVFLALIGMCYFPVTAGAVDNAVEFLSSQPGHIFVGNKGLLEIKVDRSNPSFNKMGLVEIKDEQGNLVSKSSVDLRVNHPVVEVKDLGYYSIELLEERAVPDTPRVWGKTTIAILPTIIGDSTNPFGLWHVHGDLKTGLKAGAHWERGLRTFNSYTLDASGKVVSKPPAKMRTLPVWPGYMLIDTLSYGLPDFLKNKGEKVAPNLYPPKDWPLFERLVEQFARDYDYVPEYFSVYNEPENFWHGSDQELVRFLDTIARAFKKVHPETKILGPGLATIKIGQLRKLAQLGLFEHLDGFVTNAYAERGGPEGEFIERVRELKNFLKEIGQPGMPIYITEYGWTSAPGVPWQKPVDELTQARYVARSLALLRAEEVTAAIYFCLRFNGDSAVAKGFSVTHSDGTPKPAYVAFATASRMMGHDGVSSLAEVGDGTRLFQLREKNSGGAVVVVWGRGAGDDVFVPGEFSKSVVDLMGRPLDVSETFKVGESPLYFVPKAELDDIPKILDRQIVRRGATVNSAMLQSVYVPKPLHLLNKQQVVVPVDTPPGTYWLVSDANKRITIFPFVVTD